VPSCLFFLQSLSLWLQISYFLAQRIDTHLPAYFREKDQLQKYKVELAEILDTSESKYKKVSTSINDSNASLASEENTLATGSGEASEASPVETKPRSVLKQLCEQMDTKGLLKFLSVNCRKLATASLRAELSVALKCATDPARLVLNSLEGFFPPEQTNSPGSEHNGLQVQRKSCIVLMDAIAPALGTKEPGGNDPWSSEIKEQAKAIAEEWKSKLAEVDLDASNGYSLEAQAFLQLLTTFNVDSVLDEDELCKIVVAVSRRKQTAVSCRSLGLNEKIPGWYPPRMPQGILSLHLSGCCCSS
jgi:hypothetical protein